MSNWERRFQEWLYTNNLDPLMKEQLNEMKYDKEKIKDAFYKPLSFIDGGMCGVLGPGINRMNIYTVRKAVKGLAFYIEKNCVNYKDRGVVISYDSRHMSKKFAMEAAKVLGVHGIKAYVFTSISPTPILPFAVSYAGAVAGIMITGGQLPATHNGFKIYNEKGSLISLDEVNEITTYINQIKNECTIEVIEEEQLIDLCLLAWINDEVDNAYLEQLMKITKMDDCTIAKDKDLQIAFTPLHGTALHLITEGLNQLNFKHVHIVEEQAVTNPEFATVQTLNPLEQLAFTEAVRLEAHILLATDPDAERLGVAVKSNEGNYKVLSSNQLGSLLMDYILMHTNKKILKSARIIKTIVSTEFGRAIAHSYGVKTIDMLTEFNYSGTIMNDFNATGETLIFGYEENHGYLISNFSRSKDAIQAAVMTCEMAQYWKDKGMTLLDALDALYEEHGFFKEGSHSLTLEGITAQEEIASIVHNFRHYNHEFFGEIRVEYIEDYFDGTRTYKEDERESESFYLSKGNVVKYVLEDQCWVCLVPSETVPEIKWYYGAFSKIEAETDAKLASLKKALKSINIQPKVTK